MIKNIKRRLSSRRLSNEIRYEIALSELEDGKFRYGIWSEALSNARGDEAAARALYIKYRVRSLRDEELLIDHAAASREESQNQEVEEKELNFKDNAAAFEYACKFLNTEIRKTICLPAMVLEKKNGSSYCMAQLKIASEDGGFALSQPFPENLYENIGEDDLVLWRAVACGDRNLGDRSAWSGSIDALLSPIYDVDREAWVIKYHF
ncbi:hypothetical protein [Alloalcanivorax balearicus]|uniref:hypothetical protein n=1 Tax=Alloalcanivorax balearicus TaxID=413232 RepID=UPI0021CD27BF|nr:hypothetical protein [Alloalcanivorax balearicus]